MDQCSKGMLSTVAGCAEPGHSGDGTLATLACLNEPKNLCFDAEGNLFIADSENHVIRRVMRSTGLIETVAGFVPHSSIGAESSPPPIVSEEPPEEADPLADVEDSPDRAYTQTPDLSGTVRYIVGQGMGRDRFAGDGGLATQALLNFPCGRRGSYRGTIYCGHVESPCSSCRPSDRNHSNRGWHRTDQMEW